VNPADLAAAAALRLDMPRMRELERRAAEGQELTPVERLALRDLQAGGRAT
jgi:hypothetical protein